MLNRVRSLAWRAARRLEAVLAPAFEPQAAVLASAGLAPQRRVTRRPPLADYVHTVVDRRARLAEATTALERVYYGHKGRPIMKWAHYLPLYDQALSRFVGKAPSVLEIGLAQGGSLQVWRSYLGPDAHVVGLDLDETARRFEADGFPIYIGDQADAALLARIAAEHGPFDVIIDDGSHLPRHQLASFHALWPHLKADGVYVCEDLHSNYWEAWEGGLHRDDTFIAFLKGLVDRLHDKYWRGAEQEDVLPDELAFVTLGDSIAFLHKQIPRDPRVDCVGAQPS